MATAIEERVPGASRRLLHVGLAGLLVGGILGAALTRLMWPTTGGEVAAPPSAVEVGRMADGLRYQRMAEAHLSEVASVAKGRAGDALRYQALAASLGVPGAPQDSGLTRGQIADRVRYQALAEAHLDGSRGRAAGP